MLLLEFVLMPRFSVRFRANVVAFDLFPGTVIDSVLISGARHRHVPLHRPVVSVIETLASIRLRRSMQEAPGLKFLRLQEPSGLADEVMDIRSRILFDFLDGSRLRPKHCSERLTVEVVAG